MSNLPENNVNTQNNDTFNFKPSEQVQCPNKIR